MKGKKGTLGLNTAKGFMMLILIIAVIAFAMLITLANLRDVGDDVMPTYSGSAANETLGAPFYENGTRLTADTDDARRNVKCSVSACINVSADISGNWSEISECVVGIPATAGAVNFTGATLNCSYTYTWIDPYVETTLLNVSTGTSEFFADTDTWFTLLSVVIIIMIIALVIFAVSRFGGGGVTRGEVSDDRL